jgi:hypothetical protein
LASDRRVHYWRNPSNRVRITNFEECMRAAVLALVTFAFLIGCQHAIRPSSDNLSPWLPDWETAPDKNKNAKPKLSPTLVFNDADLAQFEVLDTDEQKERHKQEIGEEELFIQIFRRLPECKSVTFKRSNPSEADFHIDVFNGLDGRRGRWQWVLYRADTRERMGFGEELDADSLVKSVCLALRATVEPTGGNVE